MVPDFPQDLQEAAGELDGGRGMDLPVALETLSSRAAVWRTVVSRRIPCNYRYYHRKKPRYEGISHRFVLGIKISINGKQDKTKDDDDCDVKDQHESTDGSAACPVSMSVRSSGSLAKLAATRRASPRVNRLVAQRCDAAICPKSGEKRKRGGCARNDVDDAKPAIKRGKLSRFFASVVLPDLGLVVQDDVQQRVTDFQFSVVFDIAQLAKFIHEKTHA